MANKLYVEAWLAYHRAADKIDGHIKSPGTKEEYDLIVMAQKAGREAMAKVLGQGYLELFNEKDFYKANLKALEIIENG